MSAPYSKLMRTHYLNSRCLIVCLCIAALGPYVVPSAGLRIEHFMIYGSLLYVVMFKIFSRANTSIPKNIFLLAVLCLAVVFWILLVSLENLSWASLYKILAALENFTQPAALVIVIFSVVQPLDRVERLNLLWVASIATIVMLCMNSLVAILTIFYDTWPFVQYFTVAGDEIETVSQRAASMGRFSGVFNQPAEAGLAYSIGILVWVYLGTTSKRISSIGWLSLMMIIIGGSLAVSKTFIFGGFPLAMLYWFWTSLRHSFIRKSTIIGGMIWGLGGVVVTMYLVESWNGLSRLLSFFNGDGYDKGVIYLVTGARFGGGEPSVILPLFVKTWNESPIMGFGIATRNPYVFDNAYIEFFFFGGIVGLALCIAILALIFRVALRGLRTDPKLGRLLMALWILIIGASVGAPVLTINRSSIFLWVILVITFGVLSKRGSSRKSVLENGIKITKK